MAAAQHGFYSAVPDNWKVNRYTKAKGRKLPMPDYSNGEYLYEWLQQVGFYTAPSSGYFVALTHKDLWPFFQLMGIEPQAWEVTTLIRASRAYIGGYNMGQSEAAYSPMELEEQ